MIVNTQFIVLEKHPYRESALLLKGLSPDYGRIGFVAHRAQKITDNAFTGVDLYRELNIEFKDDRPGDLFTADKIELLNDFSDVAESSLYYKTAARIGRFLMRNAAENIPLPYTYDAASSVFRHLADKVQDCQRWTLVQCAVVMKVAFLYENGMLPEGANESQNDFLENLVAAGIDGSELPACPEQYWSQLNNWMNSLLEINHLER